MALRDEGDVLWTAKYTFLMASTCLPRARMSPPLGFAALHPNSTSLQPSATVPSMQLGSFRRMEEEQIYFL